MQNDLCVIGAGPAGMMAAIAAGQEGASVCVLEKNAGPGRKLRMTGGGRCNLTHAGSIDDFVKACQPYGHTLKPAFYTFSPEETPAFFHQRGLKTYTDPSGCVFPVSEQAGDVCRVLVEQMHRSGVAVICDRPLGTVEQAGDLFVVTAGNERYSCRAIIVATGGKSWPQTGSTGDGCRVAEQFGHSIIPPVGILCPMIARESWPGDLQGLSLPHVVIRLKERAKSKAKTFSGEIVFTGDGIGGPAVFDVSRIAAELLNHQEAVEVTIDFLPELHREELSQRLIERCAANPKKEIAGVLSEWFPKRLAVFLQHSSCGSQPVPASGFLKQQRQKLIEAIKAMPLTLIRNGSLEKATVTRGGVSHNEIDPHTMESRLCKGLFFAGEVIDIDGPCGGYNLQIAFSTGVLAGKSAAHFCH